MLFEKPKAKGPSTTLRLGDSLDEAVLVRGTARLLQQAYVGIVSASGEAAQGTTDTSIREDALRWRILATSRIDAIRTIEDPRLRFAAFWTLATQFRISLMPGVGPDRFGSVQKYFLSFAQTMEKAAIELGYDAFPDTVIDAARPAIIEIAGKEGIAGWVDPEELGQRAAKSSGDSPISQILSIPLAPFSGMQGVGDTPTAINNFTAAAREMTRVVDHLPERTRWQLELFMLEAQSSGAIASTLDEAAAIRKEIAKLGSVVEGLPEKVGGQTQAVIKSMEAMQPKLGENIGQANTLVRSVQDAAARIDTAAQAVTAAAAESKALTQELNKPKPEDRRSAEEKKDNFTSENVTQAAKEVRAAAGEIRLLVADLHGPTSMPAADRATDRLDKLVWQMTWNAAGLIVLAFVCGVAWLVVARRLRR